MAVETYVTDKSAGALILHHWVRVYVYLRSFDQNVNAADFTVFGLLQSVSLSLRQTFAVKSFLVVISVSSEAFSPDV